MGRRTATPPGYWVGTLSSSSSRTSSRSSSRSPPWARKAPIAPSIVSTANWMEEGCSLSAVVSSFISKTSYDVISSYGMISPWCGCVLGVVCIHKIIIIVGGSLFQIFLREFFGIWCFWFWDCCRFFVKVSFPFFLQRFFW